MSASRTSVTVRMEWDMGHRLPNHGGQCRNLHGHRYVADVVFDGPVERGYGLSTEGMVDDFGTLKSLLRSEIDKLDHRLLICDRDPLATELRGMPGVVLVPFIPTAEEIAQALLRALRLSVGAGSRCVVAAVRLWETPTASVEAT